MADLAYFYGALLGGLHDPFVACSLMGALCLGLNRQPVYWALLLALIPFSIIGVAGGIACMAVWGVATVIKRTPALF